MPVLGLGDDQRWDRKSCYVDEFADDVKYAHRCML